MRRISMTLTAFLTVIAIACSDLPTASEPPGEWEIQFAKGGKGKGGSGNDFDDATMAFDDALGGITSDGGGAYDEGVRIHSGGQILWNIAPRFFNVDLSLAQQESGSAGCADNTPPDCRLTPGSKQSDTGALTVLASQDPYDPLDGQLLGMGDGDSYPAMLRSGVGPPDLNIQISFQFPWLLDPTVPISQEIAVASDFLTVTRNGNTWTVATSGAPDDQLLVYSQSGRGKKNLDIRDEGSFHAPFAMTIDCPSCPPPS